ncbi:MAG TPA: hypothetical protein VGS23_06760 [Thermoplasmata archaeon]|nr:hypothetical protein [Thermoplasmata archaeon]
MPSERKGPVSGRPPTISEAEWVAWKAVLDTVDGPESPIVRLGEEVRARAHSESPTGHYLSPHHAAAAAFFIAGLRGGKP